MVQKPSFYSSQFRQFSPRRTIPIFLLLILLAAISSCRDQKSQSFSTGYDETQSNTPAVSEDTPDFYDQFDAPFPCEPSPGPGMPGFSPGKSIIAAEFSGNSMPSTDDCVIKQAPPVQQSFEFYTTMEGPDGHIIEDIEADKITFLKPDEKDELPGLFSQNLPQKITTKSNIEVNTVQNTTFSWQKAEDAHWYYIWVRDSGTMNSLPRLSMWIHAEDANCTDNQELCRWVSNTTFAEGTVQWWIRAFNNAGEGPWSEKNELRIEAASASPPPNPVKLSPNNSVDTARPTFTWEAESTATEYFVFVRDSETLDSGHRIAKWVTASESGCSSGTGTCTWTANKDLVPGEARWWLRASNTSGTSDWGPPMKFSVNQDIPAVPTKLSPNSEVDTYRPTFEWEAETFANDYFVFVRDSETLDGGHRIAKWVTASESGCSSGNGTCSWTANKDLVPGEARWWLRASNTSGVSTWGSPMDFSVSQSPPGDFVSISNGDFIINGQVFRFAATNAYYLPNYEKIDPGFVTNTLDAFEDAGITVVRMWGFYDGYDCGYSQQDPNENVIQTAPGEYSEAALQDLDAVIAKGKERGIRFLLPFINYWDELGGICQYNTWAGASNPSTNMTYFINSNNTQQWFKDYISMLLNRVNTVTGIAYKNEPAIFGWEIMNEGRNSGQDPTILRNWYRNIAQYIKSIDSNHILTTGEEGFDEGTPSQYSVNQYSNTYVLRAEEGTSYLLNIAIPEIDFGSAHWYPTDWGFGYEFSQDMLNAQHAWLDDHVEIAADLGKPFLLGEYGYPGWANQAQVDNYEDLWNYAEDIELDGSMLWQFTIDYVKCYEFGGNICWPEGRQDAELYNSFKNHIQNMNSSN